MADTPQSSETSGEDFSSSFEDTNNTLTHGLDSFADVLNTHQRTNSDLSGKIITLEKNYAKVNLLTTREMTTDELGLVHSGFIFSAADYAAAIAINEHNTVIIGSKVSFLAPAKVGDIVEYEAKVKFEDSRKREVSIVGKINDVKVFQGIFYAVVLEKHIFKTKIKNIKRNY